ncbi:MAG: DUF2232 domain-containing protein [Tissierellia bacterium]|nr:DUF2232 domain-containing protein [Tissierellia bacterium]
MNIDGKKGNKIIEGIFVIAIATVFMLIGMYYLPLIIFLYPIFFIVLGVRNGVKYNIISLIISSLFVGLIIDNVSGIFILLIFAPLSIGLNYMIKKRRKSFEIIAISTVILLVSFLLVINIMGDMSGVSIISQLEDSFTQALNSQIEILKDMDLSAYEVLKIRDLLENAMDYVLLILPAIVIIFSLVISYLNYLISSLILRRLGYGIVSIPKFSKFKLPNNVLLGTGIMFLGAFIIKGLKLFYYETILLNITVIASFMFFTQGLSVVDYKLIEKNLGRIPRLLIILFFTIILPLGWLISFIGILDVIIDFRKLRRPA